MLIHRGPKDFKSPHETHFIYKPSSILGNMDKATLPNFVLQPLKEKEKTYLGPRHSLICPDHPYKVCRVVGRVSDTHNLPERRWAVLVECTNCGKNWYSCLFCVNSRGHFLSAKQLADHERNASEVHSAHFGRLQPQKEQGTTVSQEKTVVQEDVILGTEDSCAMEDFTESSKEEEDLPVAFQQLELQEIPPGEQEFGFSELHCQEFFRMVHEGGSLLSGIESLVVIAQRGVVLPHSHHHNPPKEQTMLQMELATLCSRLSRDDRKSLASVLSGTYAQGSEDGFTSASRQWGGIIGNCQGLATTAPIYDFRKVCQTHKFGLEIPRSSNQINRLYISGTNSVTKRLPCPGILETAFQKGHRSSSRLIDLLRHFLAFWQPEPHTAIQTNNGRLVIGIVEWKDGFDPNSFSKLGRGGADIHTVTFFVGDPSCGRKLEYTYPLAVGNKDNPHLLVEHELSLDLQLLRDGKAGKFYLGCTRQWVEVVGDILVTIMDQPERRKTNFMAQGNGSYSCRFGVSANHRELYKFLRACSKCLQNMEAFLQSNTMSDPSLPICCDCLNWDVLKESPLALYVAPKSYPLADGCIHVATDEAGNLKLRPFRISYGTLKDAVSVVHQKLESREWTKANAEAYLRVEGLSQEAYDAVINHGQNAAALRRAREQHLGDSPAGEAVMSDYHSNPHLYNPWPIPSRWSRGVPLSRTIDPLMHLLFLGIVKTVGSTVRKYLVSYGQHKSFSDRYSYLLLQAKDLKLDWLKVLSYGTGNYGGWVSENCLAYARLMPWFYQDLDIMLHEPSTDDPPSNLPSERWLAKHNKNWLTRRGLDDTGSASQLKKRVAEYLKMDNVPQILPVFMGGNSGGHSALVFSLLNALSRMLQAVMITNMSPDSVTRMDASIKVFLNKFDDVEKLLRPNNAVPAVTSTPNMMCLLNLPRATEEHGPLRKYWEGAICGEGFLAKVKSNITQGMRPGWEDNLMKNIHAQKTFMITKEQIKNKDLDGLKKMSIHAPELYENKAQFSEYKSQANLIMCWRDRKPLSVICTEKGEFFAVLDATTGELVSIAMDHQQRSLTVAGLSYFGFELNTQGRTVLWTEIDPVPKVSYCVLLPLLRCRDTMVCNKTGTFAVISSNWHSLSLSKDFHTLL